MQMRTILREIESHWAQMEKSPNIEILRKHGDRAHLITLGFTSEKKKSQITF